MRRAVVLLAVALVVVGAGCNDRRLGAGEARLTATQGEVLGAAPGATLVPV